MTYRAFFVFIPFLFVLNFSSKKNGLQEQNISIGYLNFKLSGNLKKIDKEDLSECAEWIFTEQLANNILEKMIKVEATEVYLSCYQYSCWYEGIVKKENEKYEIVIYAGGYITLSNEREILHFIMKEESDLFLSSCTCCDEN